MGMWWASGGGAVLWRIFSPAATLKSSSCNVIVVTILWEQHPNPNLDIQSVRIAQQTGQKAKLTFPRAALKQREKSHE